MHNITWLVFPSVNVYVSILCLVLVWSDCHIGFITRLTTWSQFDRRRDLILIEIIMPFDFHASWFLFFLLCSSEGGSVSAVMASASSSIKGRSSRSPLLEIN
jgi:hypothetical protein